MPGSSQTSPCHADTHLLNKQSKHRCLYLVIYSGRLIQVLQGRRVGRSRHGKCRSLCLTVLSLISISTYELKNMICRSYREERWSMPIEWRVQGDDHKFDRTLGKDLAVWERTMRRGSRDKVICAGHATVVTLQWSRYSGHATVVTLQWSRHSGHATVVTLQWSRYSGHATVVTLQWSRYSGHATVVITLKVSELHVLREHRLVNREDTDSCHTCVTHNPTLWTAHRVSRAYLLSSRKSDWFSRSLSFSFSARRFALSSCSDATWWSARTTVTNSILFS